MHNLFLLTVKHTGTHFAFNFLTNLGMAIGSQYSHLHVTDYLPKKRKYERILNSKVLLTARDPRLGALRVAGQMQNIQSSQQNVNVLATSWGVFLDLLPKINHHIIDIGCVPEQRHSHINSAIEFLGRKPLPDLNKFVDSWTPANVNKENKEYKITYLETGDLPPKIDFTGLDRAYEWYKSLPTNALY